MKMKFYAAVFGLFMFCVPLIAASQTDYQIALVKDFVRTKGASVINGWAHPLYTATEYTVEHTEHTYYITLYYKNGNGYFRCSYRLSLTSGGEISSFYSYDCNSPFSFLFKCFEFSDAVREQVSRWAQDEDNGKYTRLIGKGLSQFTCSDVCTVRIYQEWHSGGYYAKY